MTVYRNGVYYSTEKEDHEAEMNFHARRLARRMKDPTFRAAYEEACRQLAHEDEEPEDNITTEQHREYERLTR